jgi:hypothetical protein
VKVDSGVDGEPGRGEGFARGGPGSEIRAGNQTTKPCTRGCLHGPVRDTKQPLNEKSLKLSTTTDSTPEAICNTNFHPIIGVRLPRSCPLHGSRLRPRQNTLSQVTGSLHQIHSLRSCSKLQIFWPLNAKDPIVVAASTSALVSLRQRSILSQIDNNASVKKSAAVALSLKEAHLVSRGAACLRRGSL